MIKVVSDPSKPRSWERQLVGSKKPQTSIDASRVFLLSSEEMVSRRGAGHRRRHRSRSRFVGPLVPFPPAQHVGSDSQVSLLGSSQCGASSKEPLWKPGGCLPTKLNVEGSEVVTGAAGSGSDGVRELLCPPMASRSAILLLPPAGSTSGSSGLSLELSSTSDEEHPALLQPTATNVKTWTSAAPTEPAVSTATTARMKQRDGSGKRHFE